MNQYKFLKSIPLLGGIILFIYLLLKPNKMEAKESSKVLTADSPLMLKFMNHVFKWEGKTSSDPDDTTAAKCVPLGNIHTNMGVTFCTYKEMAERLGLPPTYEYFSKNLTKNDVRLFIYEFLKKGGFLDFFPKLSIAMLETMWLSGKERAYICLQRAMKDLGYSVGIYKTQSLVNLVNSQDQNKLVLLYWKHRKAHLDALAVKKPKYKNGWVNRYNDFEKNYLI